MSREWHDYACAEDIRCPHCNGHLGWETEDVPVTYWGEGEMKDTCPYCAKEFWLEEHVNRNWTLGRTKEGARWGDDV